MKIGYAVGSIMAEDIVSVEAGSPLTRAIKTMVEKNIGSVLVTERVSRRFPRGFCHVDQATV
jgi:CBS domain-containing protein